MNGILVIKKYKSMNHPLIHFDLNFFFKYLILVIIMAVSKSLNCKAKKIAESKTKQQNTALASNYMESYMTVSLYFFVSK